MPVEDINFLHAHGSKESKIIFIDSSQRDKIAYPTPSEYVVEFTEPFHNVHGIDILDAAIPRTMYNIDTFNNQLVVGVGPTALTQDITITMTNRDYNLDTLLAELGTKMTKIKAQYTINATSLGDGRMRIVFTSIVPFVFDMKNSTLSEALGFSTYAVTTDTENYVRIVDATMTDTNIKNRNYQLFGSVSKRSSLFTQYYGAISTDPNLVPAPINFFKINDHTALGQKITSPDYTYLDNIIVQVTEIGTYPDLTQAALTWKIVLPDESGANKPSLNSADVIRSGKLTLDITKMIATSDVQSKDDFNLIALNPLAEYWIIIEDGYNTSDTDYLAVPYTINVVTNMNNGTVITNSSDNTWVSTGMGNGKSFCIEVQTVTKIFTITSPGVVSLVGERFVTLRCPEVEQYIYGSVAFGNNSPGLALFKLGVVGYSDSRFDFSSVPSKEFHPIGKLSKLTLRYEVLKGMVYDFKGVNHHLMIVIRYLTAKKPGEFKDFSLNPNYTSNFMNHLRIMEEKEGDSDDEDDIDDLTFRNEYLKKEQEYDFDESEEIEYLPVLDDEDRQIWEMELRK
jgi:hypothetical protein